MSNAERLLAPLTIIAIAVAGYFFGEDAAVGGIVHQIEHLVGKFVIGIYIGIASVGSVYGAAGSLIVVLVWTYYSSQILFFGAELIRAYAKYFDSQRIVPTELAVPMAVRSSPSSRHAIIVPIDGLTCVACLLL